MSSDAPPGVTILSELGRGAQTVVYRVRRDGRDWAMKVFLGAGAGADPSALRREAALLAWTNHPGLPRVHEASEVGHRPYLIMELIEGRSLAELLRVRPLPVDRTLHLGIELAGALAALHDVGLVHRDVKPHNIMIEPGGAARLIDLGMAGRATAKRTESAVGTLQYSAPEQGGTLNRPVDARSDLYALGAVLHECLTGAPPFSSTDASELLRLHAGATPPDPRDVRPEVPATLAAVIAKLLAKDPDDRYQTGAVLVADLRRLAADPSAVFPLAGAATPAEPPTPLVGRARELDQLTERWRQAQRGRGSFAVITGGTGTGKTRLARELVRLAGGGQFLFGQCPEEPVPLAPLRAALGDADEIHHDDPETFTRLVAARVEDLARERGAALLVIDDAHRADEATLAVLRLLAAGIAEVPLLVLTTGRQTTDADLVVTLDPLCEEAVVELVGGLAHGRDIDAAALSRLAARSGTTPLEIQEYLAAVIDAGVLTPYRGRWRLDADGLDRIALPEDLHALVLRRLDGLSEQCRDLLTAGAVLGPVFPVAEVADAAAVEREHASGILAEAVTRGAVRRRADGYGFAHEQLRLALLDAADPERLRDLHQRVAKRLDAAGGEEPAHTYALARHYLNGHPDRDPARTAEVCRAAGVRALADSAPGKAVTFLETAYRLSGEASEIGELLGSAYRLSGRTAQALETLTAALENAPDRLARARILLALCLLHADAWDIDPCLEAMHRALSELDRELPGNQLRLLAGTIGRFVAGLAVERSGLGFGTATGEDATRFRLEAQLYGAGGAAASLGLNPMLALALLLRSLYPVTRLGLCIEYIHTRTDVSCFLELIGGERFSGGYARAARAAVAIGDRAAEAFVLQQRRLTKYIAGRGSPRDILADSADPERLINAGRIVTQLGGTLWIQLLAGLARDAEALYQDGAARVAAADLPESSLILAGASVAAALGRVAEADAALCKAAEHAEAFRNPSRQVSLLLAQTQVAVEQRDLGETFDRVAASFDELALSPKTMLVPLRGIYVYLAYGRIEQCRAAPPDRRDQALAAAGRAVATLVAVGSSTLLKAHGRVARGWLRLLGGDAAGALAGLAAADELVRTADAPLVSFEAARLRAHTLRALGQLAEATVAAAGASVLAAEYHWPHRSQWIRDEFGVDGAAGAVARTSGATGTDLTAAAYRLRLEAVDAMSVASARIVDPAALIRVALDETIRLLSAERAYLFLTDDHGRLTPHLGRDATGNDLTELVGYGSTLVERARHSREPLVVTGTDEGAALGSRSTVAHGLRSIMVSPLLHDGRLLGVVYLDSRVAKGMFTKDDVGVLTAITTHVAATLETARAAQLSVDVRSAQHERDMAETLRTAMEHVSGTLVPAEVLDRLGEVIGRALDADRVLLAVRDGDKLVVGDETIEPGATAEVPAAFRGGASSWLAVPLRTRDEEVGAVFVLADRPGAYRENHREIAAALARQGMTAYENALLFTKVERLAVTDGLTGLYNRRHFFQLAGRELALARRRSSPLAAMMLDIDHFKQVNDRHGHPVGDQVIVEVARRLEVTARQTDVIGRYGGEEFAMFLPDTDLDGAIVVGERVRAVIAGRPVDTDAGPLPVTASIGLAGYDLADTDPAAALARADDALYRAKQGGRNRVAT